VLHGNWIRPPLVYSDPLPHTHSGQNPYKVTLDVDGFAEFSVSRVPPESVSPVPPESVSPVPPESVSPVPPESVSPVPPESVRPVPPECVSLLFSKNIRRLQNFVALFFSQKPTLRVPVYMANLCPLPMVTSEETESLIGLQPLKNIYSSQEVLQKLHGLTSQVEPMQVRMAKFDTVFEATMPTRGRETRRDGGGSTVVDRLAYPPPLSAINGMDIHLVLCIHINRKT